jgi:hypothetical protein
MRVYAFAALVLASSLIFMEYLTVSPPERAPTPRRVRHPRWAARIRDLDEQASRPAGETHPAVAHDGHRRWHGQSRRHLQD